MKTKLAIIESPMVLSKKQGKELRKMAKKRLGRKFRVMVLSGSVRCNIQTIEGKHQ